MMSLKAVLPRTQAQWGTAIGALIPAAVFVMHYLYTIAVSYSIFASLVALTLFLFFFTVYVLMIGLFRKGVGRNANDSAAVLTGAVLMILAVFILNQRPMVIGLVLGMLSVSLMAALGTVLAFAASPRFKSCRTGVRAGSSFLIAVLLLVHLYLAYAVSYSGTDKYIPVVEPDENAIHRLLDLDSPALKGDYTVRTLTYGSGHDKRRTYYGKDAEIITPTVDVSPFVGKTAPWRLNSRERYWGFPLSEVPLNAKVWFPEGKGPFPLLMIVHGNAKMEIASEMGYDYLGELLASRGYIVASIDQNFLNFSWMGDFGGLEMPARGWLLLEHLALWHQWNETEEHTFYQRVDTKNIALAGHSRGGEAVMVAALLNGMSHYPEDGTITFDYDFSIKALAAIAPSDSFYWPGGAPRTLEDIHFLLIQGAHDGDISVMLGNNQYQRIRFTQENWFKSVVYAHHANHSQFNSRWGRIDLSFPFTRLINTKPVMKDSEQRQIAEVYMAAFLDTALLGNTEYMPLFQDTRTALHWLPRTSYLSRFEDGGYKVIADFEEDVDLSTTTAGGGSILGTYLTTWHEGRLPFRFKGMEQQNRAVYLSWDQEMFPGQNPVYSLLLPDDLTEKWEIDSDSFLIFSMLDEDIREQPVSFAIELITRDGEAVKMPIHDLTVILPSLPVQWTKFGMLEKPFAYSAERLLQSYRIPLAAFIKENAEFDAGGITEIRFVFENTPRGSIILDQIGFR